RIWLGVRQAVSHLLVVGAMRQVRRVGLGAGPLSHLPAAAAGGLSPDSRPARFKALLAGHASDGAPAGSPACGPRSSPLLQTYPTACPWARWSAPGRRECPAAAPRCAGSGTTRRSAPWGAEPQPWGAVSRPAPGPCAGTQRERR